MKKEAPQTGLVIHQDLNTRVKYNVILTYLKELTDKNSAQIADEIWQRGINIVYAELQNSKQ